MAWLRITAAAILFAIWRRPWSSLRHATIETRRTIIALGAVFAAIAITPLGLLDAAPALSSGLVLGAGVVVGITSSVVPYVFDQLAMVRLPRSTYALFVALLPATAVIIGVLVLGQHPTGIEIAGVSLVIAGIAIHHEPQ